MRRSVIIHTVLLISSLAAAYWVWTRDPTLEANEVTLLRFRSGIDRAIYETPTKKVEIEQRKDALSDFIWVTAAKTKPVKQPTKPTKTPPPLLEEKKTKITTFKGNDTAEKMAQTLSQLSAIRALGKLDEAKLKEFGLTDSNSTLTVVSGTTTRVFVIGSTTYGNSDFYVLDKDNEAVYVLKGTLKRELDYADFRYIDRRLTRIKTSEMEKVVLRLDGDKDGTEKIKRTLRQHGIYKNASAAFWTFADSDTPEEMCKNWVKMFDTLKVEEYIGDKADLPPLKTVLAVEIFGTGRRKDAVTIYRKDADSDGGSQYYAQGTNTRSYVRLNRAAADALMRELGHLVTL